MIESLEELEKNETMNILRQAKIPINWLGYKCIITAIPMIINDFNSTQASTLKNIYKEVAKKHKTTATKVECAIRYVHENTQISSFLGYERLSNKSLLYTIADMIMIKLRL